MVLKNKKTGQLFPVTQAEFQDKIVSKGLSEKYDIVEDDKPVELKRLSVELHKKRPNDKNK